MRSLQREVPVYLVTGFLESGKTSFLTDIIRQRDFMTGKSLLILTEEGEEEYSPEDLKRSRTTLELISDSEALTTEALTAFEKKYRPDRVFIEYNPTWTVKKLYDTELPRGWELVQHIVTIDAGTYMVYVNNMRSVFTDMLTGADTVVFNRCTKDLPLASYRRSVKAVSVQAGVIFENTEGKMIDIMEEAMPFDLSADVVQIDDIDYGIWYIDLTDHPDKYAGKTVRFRGQVLKSEEDSANFFVPGRKAMTCCANDIRYMGYLCKTPLAKTLKMGSWVEVTAQVKEEYHRMYNGKGPVFYAETITPTDAPEEELVYFN